MRRFLFLFVALSCGALSFAQDNDATKKILELSKIVMTSSNPSERDEAVNQMKTIAADLPDGITKNTIFKLVNASANLANEKKYFVPANDLSVLTKDDLKKFKVETDKFTGKTTIYPNFMYSNPTIRMKIIIKDSEMSMYIINTYEGFNWIFMDSAIVLVDGQKFTYKLNGDSRDVLGPSRVLETSVDIVDDNVMKMVEAVTNSTKPIEVQFSGSKGNKEFQLPEKTKERWAGMLNIYNKLKK